MGRRVVRVTAEEDAIAGEDEDPRARIGQRFRHDGAVLPLFRAAIERVRSEGDGARRVVVGSRHVEYPASGVRNERSGLGVTEQHRQAFGQGGGFAVLYGTAGTFPQTGPGQAGSLDMPRDDVDVELAHHVAERGDVELDRCGLRPAGPAQTRAISSIRRARSAASRSMISTASAIRGTITSHG